jgi:hypothetical protein
VPLQSFFNLRLSPESRYAKERRHFESGQQRSRQSGSNGLAAALTFTYRRILVSMVTTGLFQVTVVVLRATVWMFQAIAAVLRVTVWMFQAIVAVLRVTAGAFQVTAAVFPDFAGMFQVAVGMFQAAVASGKRNW